MLYFARVLFVNLFFKAVPFQFYALGLSISHCFHKYHTIIVNRSLVSGQYPFSKCLFQPSCLDEDQLSDYHRISNLSLMSKQVLPKVIWEESRCKVPINYNGTPQIQPQTCLFNDNHSHAIRPSLSDSTHHLKRHPDPLSRFVTIGLHFADSQTRHVPTLFRHIRVM